MQVMDIPCRRVQVFSWRQADGTETRWFVDMAIDLISYAERRGYKIPTAELTLEDAKYILTTNRNLFEEPLKPENIDAANLGVPLIAVELRDNSDGQLKHVIIDGWHRLHKAVKIDWQAPIIVHVLPEELAKEVEV